MIYLFIWGYVLRFEEISGFGIRILRRGSVVFFVVGRVRVYLVFGGWGVGCGFRRKYIVIYAFIRGVFFVFFVRGEGLVGGAGYVFSWRF